MGGGNWAVRDADAEAGKGVVAGHDTEEPVAGTQRRRMRGLGIAAPEHQPPAQAQPGTERDVEPGGQAGAEEGK
ncbi:hypothetical protein LZ554_005850 [Drepanopeziza brunnea f. sp. 'monogermtubi']|nr:hypothetical protein LZ554_005850 [Drepanopeziza brunnea f. sp. 'monogermtubi']